MSNKKCKPSEGSFEWAKAGDHATLEVRLLGAHEELGATPDGKRARVSEVVWREAQGDY